MESFNLAAAGRSAGFRRFLLALGGAALAIAGYGYGRWSAPTQTSPRAHAGFPCSPSYVHDGDTFRCGDGTRIRVAGINAREIGWDGTKSYDAGCNEGAPCPTIDAVAAREKLARLLGTPASVDENGNEHVSGPTLTCDPNGTSYDRIAAFCFTPDGRDVSCAMVADGAAATWPRYWKDHRC